MSIEIHALAGAYALDAVNDLERVQFSRHLADCDACGLEVAELRTTAARLADSTWAVAPPRLKENVLRETSHTRQARPGRPGGRGTGPADEPARPGRWRRWAATGIAAAVLAAGAAAATFALEERRVGDERQHSRQLADRLTRIQSVMAARDARASQVPVGGGRLAVVHSAGQDSAVVMCAGLDMPDRAHAYQVWLMHDGEATSAGVLPAGTNAGTMLVTGVGDADAIAISLQQAGGEKAPGQRAATVKLA